MGNLHPKHLKKHGLKNANLGCFNQFDTFAVFKIWERWGHLVSECSLPGTVDGRNAPVDIMVIPLSTGFHTCWVVQDFFHQYSIICM